MYLRITSDSNKETRVGEVIQVICGPTEKYFSQRNYGSSVDGIAIIFMCRDPRLVFKQRIRFLKVERKLYADIMMDYESMISAPSDEVRFNLMKKSLIAELSRIIKKYKFVDFDQVTFISDLEKYLVFNSDRSTAN